MTKFLDPNYLFLRKLYTEALKTHLGLNFKPDVIAELISLPGDHTEIICHLDKSKYIGKHSHSFNRYIDDCISNGEKIDIPGDIWPEVESPELTDIEYHQILEMKNRQMLILKNIFENIITLGDKPLITSDNSWYLIYEKNIFGDNVFHEDVLLLITGKMGDIPIVEAYDSMSLVHELSSPISRSSIILKGMSKSQRDELDRRLMKEIKMYKHNS